jgi:hypothetical protein
VNDTTPSTAEIAALTARLRALSDAGAAADPAQRARFLADKDRLLDRISAASSRAEPRPSLRGRDNQHAVAAADTALDDAVRARAELGGYALVGPSARTWRTDPDTGRLLEPVSEAEHRTLRHLLGNETVTTTEPAWTDTPDGQDVAAPSARSPTSPTSTTATPGPTKLTSSASPAERVRRSTPVRPCRPRRPRTSWPPMAAHCMRPAPWSVATSTTSPRKSVPRCTGGDWTSPTSRPSVPTPWIGPTPPWTFSPSQLTRAPPRLTPLS